MSRKGKYSNCLGLFPRPVPRFPDALVRHHVGALPVEPKKRNQSAEHAEGRRDKVALRHVAWIHSHWIGFAAKTPSEDSRGLFLGVLMANLFTAEVVQKPKLSSIGRAPMAGNPHGRHHRAAMAKSSDVVANLLLPALDALAQVAPAAAVERRRRMAKNPATFVRGSLILHVAWLAANPLAEAPWVWSIGDAHLGNFATLATGPLNRNGISPVTYGVADVDDEHPAPWQWDGVRLLASLGVMLDKNGGGRKHLVRLTHALLGDYVRVLTAATDDDEHAERIDFHGLPEALKAAINDDAEPERLMAHRLALIAGQRLRPGPSCVVDAVERRLLQPAVEAALATVAPAKELRVLDLARRISGGGLASLGRRRWWVLVQERDREGMWAPRLLELKERRPSVLSAILPAQPFAPSSTRPWTLPMGGDRWQCRVPLGFGDALLRTRCQARTVLDPTTMDEGDLLRLVRLWGQLLAVAHLTSARGLGLPAKKQATAIVVNAKRHADAVAEQAWKLVTWTRDAYREFIKA